MSSSLAYYLCAKANSPSFFAELTDFAVNSARLSEFSPPKQYSRNSIPLPFPKSGAKKGPQTWQERKRHIIRKGRTWAIAVRRGSYKSLFLLNSGVFSLEK